jgi:hypothetical protein
MPQLELTVQNIRTYTLIAGIANALGAILGTVGVVVFGASTLGCGCVFIIFPVLHLAACLFDFLAYARLGESPSPPAYSTAKTSAIFDLLSGVAIVPLIMGIMKLQLLGSEEVRAYFHHHHAEEPQA